MYTKDALLLPPGVPPINGSEAIGRYWAERIKGGLRKNHTYEIVRIQEDEKFVSQVARFTVDVINGDGKTIKVAGNTIRVFEKQPDGKWLTKVHIFNAD